jgi:hypothetical protein
MSDNLPGRPAEESGLPARRLTGEQMEAVIRRATELQFAAGGGEEGVSETELLRIGRELGLDPTNLRRALAEVRTAGGPAERGVLTTLMGDRVVRASRIFRKPAAQLGLFLEEYLRKSEFMDPVRRYPDRTRYARASGIGAAFGRAAAKISARQASLDVPQLDVGNSALDEGSALVELSVDQGGLRAGLTAGGAAVGSAGGLGIITVAMMTPVPDPVSLVAIPILGASMAIMRAIYRHQAGSVENRLEAFLDRLEHGELRLPPNPPPWRRQLGF